MPAAVKQALRDAFVLFGEKTEVEAGEIIKALVDNGRLYEECWS